MNCESSSRGMFKMIVIAYRAATRYAMTIPLLTIDTVFCLLLFFANQFYLSIIINQVEHKKRVETRKSDIDSLKLPAWEDVLKRTYDAWGKDHIVIDTYNKDIEHCIKELMEKIVIMDSILLR